MSGTRPNISIVIKALNEEHNIATAIESALAALDGSYGEVILADCASTDRTVEIAARYPIKIVSLARIEDRSCGAGVQLAYQYSRGRFVCLIDGDMRLHGPFLRAAVQFLQDNPEFAGVGGMIVERETENLEYIKRANAQDIDRLPGEVSRLDCGGVYRRKAIEAVGYLGDRNLHAGEELELGIRLHAQGWKLARIDLPAIDHYGHSGNAYAMLLRRWATRYAFGTGEILRATLSHARLWLMLRKLRWELFLLAAVHVWWIALFVTPFVIRGIVPATAALAALLLLPFVVMSLRCRSVDLGIYSVTAWNVYAAGIWPGLLHSRVDPAGWIESIVLREAIFAADHADVGPPTQPRAALNNLVTPSGANGI
jgi:glycosyltransferase involved in cell wall biosynthesis